MTSVASEEERDAIQRKEREQREFFEGMERNILRKLEGGNKQRGAAAISVDNGNATATSPGNERVADGIEQSWMQT